MNDEFLRQLPPEDQSVSEILGSKAQSIQVNPQFQSNLEARLKQAHPANKQPEQGWQIKILPAIGWAILAIGAFLILNWAVRSLVPSRQPAAGETAIPTSTEQAFFSNPVSEATPLPLGEEYDWRGTTLYLGTQLPEIPTEASVYELQPEQPANIESARALAEQFGLDGQLYEAPGELPGTTNYLIVDGNQRLYVRSGRYFTYYPDYLKSNRLDMTLENPDSTALIDAFTQEHGFTFDYRITISELYGGYYALPLTPDGFSMGWAIYKNTPGYVTCELSNLGEPGNPDGVLYADMTWDLPCNNSSLTVKNSRLQRAWPVTWGYVHLKLSDSFLVDIRNYGGPATMEVYDSTIAIVAAYKGGVVYVENTPIREAVEVKDSYSVIYGYGVSGGFEVLETDGGRYVEMDEPGPPWN